jgi:hypothetical protein
MSRARLLVAACFAVLVLFTLMPSMASAAWDVNGTALVGAKAISSGVLVLSTGFLEVVSTGDQVACSSKEVTINGGEIVSPDGIRAKDLTFRECKTNSTNCALAESTILTLAIHGLAELDGEFGVFIKALPLPSKTFTVLNFTGELCAIKGPQAVTGTIDLLSLEGQVPSVLQLFKVFSLTGALKVGSSEGSLRSVHYHLGLVSGETWNFL